MNLRLLLLTVTTAMLVSGKNNKYNILSLDSTKYGGMMQAAFISYMEKRAYSIAKREKENK